MNQIEQRTAIRMNVDRALRFRMTDSFREFYGVCKNLSDSGIAFVSERSIQPGMVIAISVDYADAGLEHVMSALVEVTRCHRIDTGFYEICGQIKGVR